MFGCWFKIWRATGATGGPEHHVGFSCSTANGLSGFFLTAGGLFQESETQEEDKESCNVEKVRLVNWVDFPIHMAVISFLACVFPPPHPHHLTSATLNLLLIKRNFQANGTVGSHRLRICSPPNISWKSCFSLTMQTLTTVCRA